MSKLIKNPVGALIIQYIAWELLYAATYLPIIFTSTNRNFKPLQWEHLRYDIGILGTVNFVLFALIAFLIIPHFLIKKRQWTLLILSCLTAAILFTYFKYKLDEQHYPVLDEMTKQLNQKANNKLSHSNTDTSLAKLKAVAALPLTDSLKKRPNINTSQMLINTARPIYQVEFKLYLLLNLWFNIIIIFLAFGYVLLQQWFVNERIKRQLESQKLKAELSFLKLQVNPHFLFNALNNIYSLAILENAKRTSDSIMKLSDLIRYMLYEKEDEEYKVSLEKEINHINSFIDLQKLRYANDIFIEFSLEGEIQHKKIPSLLLFPLIENSFKHGIMDDPKKPIVIQIKVEDGTLHFSLHNFKNAYMKDGTGGIGLENVRKRLSLLFPKQDNTLTIKETLNDFLVKLQVPL